MLLYKIDLSDKKRTLNNNHSYLIVILAAIILLLFLYLFSNLHDLLSLPSIQNILLEKGIISENFFGELLDRKDSILASSNFISLDKFKKDTGIFIVIFMLCFFTTYFLPVRFKRANNIFWYLLFLYYIIDIWQILLLFFTQLIIYSSFHVKFLNKFIYINLLRFIMVNVPIFFALLKIFGINHSFFDIWFILIFARQWCRLILYWCDFRDGYIPTRLSVIKYLSIFFNLPSAISYYPYIAQSYGYIESNFLSIDKNIIALRGIKLIGLSILYFIFWRHLIKFIIELNNNIFGVKIYYPILELFNQYSYNNVKDPLTVLFSTQVFLLAVFFTFASITHFKIGLWNLLGYNIHSEIDKPLLSTNFMSLWTRLFYHYRAFLFRIFYYPIYERLRNFNIILRTLVPTIITLGFMNFILFLYGYIYIGDNYPINNLINKWPYYVLLTILVCITQIYFIKVKKRTRPWQSWKTFWVDTLAGYIVFSIYSLICIFVWNLSSNIDFDIKMGTFLRGLGF